MSRRSMPPRMVNLRAADVPAYQAIADAVNLAAAMTDTKRRVHLADYDSECGRLAAKWGH